MPQLVPIFSDFGPQSIWRIAGTFSKTTIFFKLQVGVTRVSSVPPLRLHRARATPVPHQKIDLPITTADNGSSLRWWQQRPTSTEDDSSGL